MLDIMIQAILFFLFVMILNILVHSFKIKVSFLTVIDINMMGFFVKSDRDILNPIFMFWLMAQQERLLHQ